MLSFIYLDGQLLIARHCAKGLEEKLKPREEGAPRAASWHLLGLLFLTKPSTTIVPGPLQVFPRQLPGRVESLPKSAANS